MTELAMLSLLQQSHSVLNPSSPQTRLIDRLWDAMYLVSAAVFVLVVLALLLGAFRRRGAEAPETDAGRERASRRP
jgi:heme/copper-type cytochrome/quinol oxidase subunit 2